MNSKNTWYSFTDKLDKSTCNRIKDLGGDNWKDGRVNTRALTYLPTDSKNKLDKRSRTSEIVWSYDQWIFDVVWALVGLANKNAGWNYDIRGAEGLQISRYKKGGFYGFHRDGRNDHLSKYDNPNNKFLYGYVRKLSMSILLNDEFKGGEFEVGSYRNKKCTIKKPKFNTTGSIIVFPSDVEHRVAPVKKGTRYSLVCWFLGPPFK